jgi:hypothetical protein
MLFMTYHIVNLIIFTIAVIYAWITVSKLRNTSATYNARLLPFAYFSLSSWILWGFQYAILISVPTGFFLDTGLWLGVMQNALWTSAVLSLHLKQFSRMTTLPLWIAFPIVIAFALLTYRTAVLTSEVFTYIDVVFGYAIFTAFALSILQWRLSKICAAVFFIHGYFQWLWRSVWFSPLTGISSAIFIAFPGWRIVLLLVWIRLVSAILHRAESSYRKVLADIDRLSLSKRLDNISLMISSTAEDLVQERDAAARAIESLGLSEIRAEMFRTYSEPLRIVYAFLAEECNTFILIIGERYGSQMEPEGISVVEFQYQVACAQNPEKILVYVKDGVIRQPRLQDFLTRVQQAKHGYVRSFITPEELYEEIHRGIAHWLTSHGKK